MMFPIRLARGWLPRVAERLLIRFVWNDARALLDPEIPDDDFRVTMNAIHVGGTFKITGANRHPVADHLLLDNVDLTDATIVDIGASDGSTSVDLIHKLSGFAEYVIADLYLSVQARRRGRRVFFYDATGTCILVAGPRFLAWPGMSAAVRCVYAPLLRSASRQRGATEPVLLLNPATRSLMARDPRVSCRTHDVFTPWSRPPTPDVVKVANLLRRLYFSDADISRALRAVHDSLPDGGHLLIVDDGREKGIGSRAGLYRCDQNRFVPVSRTEQLPEIDDLIVGLTG